MEEHRGHFYYDENNKRVAVREEKREGGNTTYYREIFLHEKVSVPMCDHEVHVISDTGHGVLY